MKLSEMLTHDQWKQIVNMCIPQNVPPLLIAAIGWHETHWGRLGMGKYGYYLGVSCWDRNDQQYLRDKEKDNVDYKSYTRTTAGHLYCNIHYRGISGQVGWAVEKFKGKIPMSFGYPHVLNIAKNIWKPGAPEAWAKSVWNIYSGLDIDYPVEIEPAEPEEIPTSDADLPEATGILERILFYLQEMTEILNNWKGV